MLVGDLLAERLSNQSPILTSIRTMCSQFLSETDGRPLYKSLPVTYGDAQKIKVRTKKRSAGGVLDLLNKAFESDYVNLVQRAVFTQSVMPPIVEDGTDVFYVFPTNNFKFMYSQEVRNSTTDYQHTIDTIFESFESEQQALDIVSDLLKFNYVSTQLIEGIDAKSEIILYNIPCYYVIRVDAYPKYERLLTRLHTIKGQI